MNKALTELQLMAFDWEENVNYVLAAIVKLAEIHLCATINEFLLDVREQQATDDVLHFNSV